MSEFPTSSLKNKLITFVIMGAQKSGTTSLHNYLNQHPEIFTSNVKESNIFLDDSKYFGEYHKIEPDHYGNSNYNKRRTLTNEQILEKIFAAHKKHKIPEYAGQPFVGEASTYYTMIPHSGQEVPFNIKKYNDRMKLIYILRHPLNRIISNFIFDMKIKDMKNIDFNTHINRTPHFLDISLYFNQLSNYLKHFSKNQVLVTTFEELIQHPQKTLNEIAIFIGVEKNHIFNTFVAHNVGTVGGQLEATKVSNEYLKDPQWKFSNKNYEKIVVPIKNDVLQMEEYLGKKLWKIT